jgi:hypothetical protein
VICSSVDVETSLCTILQNYLCYYENHGLLVPKYSYSRIFLGKWAAPLLLFLSLAVLLFLLVQVEALEIKLEKHCCHVCFGRCRVVGRSVEPRNLSVTLISTQGGQQQVMAIDACICCCQTDYSLHETMSRPDSMVNSCQSSRHACRCEKQ